jgi:hypothetical protein
MSLMNDYTYQVLTDAQQRELAWMAEHNRQVRLGLSGRVSWWRRVIARLQQRIRTSTDDSISDRQAAHYRGHRPRMEN